MVGMIFFIGCGIYRVNRTGGKRWLFTEKSAPLKTAVRERNPERPTPWRRQNRCVGDASSCGLRRGNGAARSGGSAPWSVPLRSWPGGF